MNLTSLFASSSARRYTDCYLLQETETTKRTTSYKWEGGSASFVMIAAFTTNKPGQRTALVEMRQEKKLRQQVETETWGVFSDTQRHIPQASLYLGARLYLSMICTLMRHEEA